MKTTKNKIRYYLGFTASIIVVVLLIVFTGNSNKLIGPSTANAANASSFSTPTAVFIGKEVPIQITPTTSSPVCTNYRVYEVPANGIIPTVASPIYSSLCITGTSYSIPTTVVLKVNTIYGVTAGFCLATNTKCASVFSVNPIIYFQTFPNTPTLITTTKAGGIMRYDQIQNKWIVVTNIGIPTTVAASSAIVPTVATQKSAVSEANPNIITSIASAAKTAANTVVKTVSNIITSIANLVTGRVAAPTPY